MKEFSGDESLDTSPRMITHNLAHTLAVCVIDRLSRDGARYGLNFPFPLLQRWYGTRPGHLFLLLPVFPHGA